MTTTISPHASGYALLVGIESYDAWPSDKQLHAGRNDVLAFYKVCRRLGMLPENIRLLTSPVIEAQAIAQAERALARERDPNADSLADDEAAATAAKVFRDEATRENILGQVVLLGAPRTSITDAPVNRLMTYSGHGAQKGDDLALCPADVGADLTGAITFSELSNIVGPVGEDLTVVLDCCFAQSSESSPGQRSTSLTQGAASTNLPDLGGRVLCASAPDQQSVQTLLGGCWRGAFSWALTIVLEQWQLVREGDSQRSSISYGHWIKRAKGLLDALSFTQTPVLLNEAAIGPLPAFHHGLETHTGETSAAPNVERHGGQLDPSAKNVVFTIKAGTTIIAEILATCATPPRSPTSHSFKAHEEYYYFKNAIPAGQFNITISAALAADPFPHAPSPYKWDENAQMGTSWSKEEGKDLFIYNPHPSKDDGFGIYWTMYADQYGGWSGWIGYSNKTGEKLFGGMTIKQINDKNYRLSNHTSPIANAKEAAAWWAPDGEHGTRGH